MNRDDHRKYEKSIEDRRKFGWVYFKADILKLAIDSVVSQRDEKESVRAMDLINEVFKDPTEEFRAAFKDYISSTELYYPFFRLI